MSDTKTCSKCHVEKPRDEFYARGNVYWCKACLRDRKVDKPYTLSRALRNRARHRATARLIERHAAEFERLVEAAKVECEAEASALAAAYDGPEEHPRLKPGARRAGELAVDRLDVARCPHCINNHDKGHVCRYCGGSPEESPDILPPTRDLRVPLTGRRSA